MDGNSLASLFVFALLFSLIPLSLHATQVIRKISKIQEAAAAPTNNAAWLLYENWSCRLIEMRRSKSSPLEVLALFSSDVQLSSEKVKDLADTYTDLLNPYRKVLEKLWIFLSYPIARGPVTYAHHTRVKTEYGDDSLDWLLSLPAHYPRSIAAQTVALTFMEARINELGDILTDGLNIQREHVADRPGNPRWRRVVCLAYGAFRTTPRYLRELRWRALEVRQMALGAA